MGEQARHAPVLPAGNRTPRAGQDAVWGEGEAMVPIGQHMANLRRKGGLGKDAGRAAERAAQLAAIDPDWTAHGPWTGNATTASSPISPPTSLVGCCLTSSLA